MDSQLKIPLLVPLVLCLWVAPCPAQDTQELRNEIAELRTLAQTLQARIDSLEKRLTPPPPQTAAAAAAAPAPAAPATPGVLAGLLANTTVNFAMDGYYGYNFNAPIGRVNLLRAYDVSSNSFSLNQADLVLENAPDPANGKRFGARLDLQFGQATETLQGNSVNEPRPDIYRNIFQAYGTYVAPIGNGLTIDFGKWSSSIGIEGNYTKDQVNYSRSFWFNYLPFYHMGVRTSYRVNDKLALNYWVTNGTNQTEAFNSFKDQLFGFNLQPSKTVSWTVNYYFGQEHPDVEYFPNGGAPPNAPEQQGVPFEPISPALKGRLHIFDSYVSWQTTPKLLLAGYARYQFTPRIALGARAEYLNDRNGLFSNTPQSLKEATLTGDYKFAEGFLVRLEWRRDLSNHNYFYTDSLGLLSNHQSTATVGVVWWFGGKQGAW
jgi:Putative beta-barrel porin-2, OmpL-like. bbp2